MKVRAALAEAERRLASIPGNPRQDAELLMAHALGVEREAMLLGDKDREAPPAFAALLARREAGEPIA